MEAGWPETRMSGMHRYVNNEKQMDRKLKNLNRFDTDIYIFIAARRPICMFVSNHDWHDID